MSTFEVPVVRVRVVAHPNADAIEIAEVGGYQSIIRKGQLRDGDLAVYIPEQAVLPEWLLKRLSLWDEARNKGALSKSAGNVVRAIRLRGVVSQGLILPGNCGEDTNPTGILVDANRGEGIWQAQGFAEGDDVAEFLGVTKYEPPIPTSMQARVLGAAFEATAKYDFENLKKRPDLFEVGEEVVATEKIHGTLIQIGVMPARMDSDKYYLRRVIVSSKGMGANGYILDHDDPTNLYAQAAKRHGLLLAAFNELAEVADEEDKPVFLFGEVYGVTEGGKGVQDLRYGGETLGVRLFDACVGNRGDEEFYTFDSFCALCEQLGAKMAPLVYRGRYDPTVIKNITDGCSTLPGAQGQIREGVVVKSTIESYHPRYGRKIAKSVSDAYLLRKGEVTEFN